jgi:hypothetical protein
MDSAMELEHIKKLAKEAECLKIRLEDERQKLNDITRNYQNFDYYLFNIFLIYHKAFDILDYFFISFLSVF